MHWSLTNCLVLTFALVASPLPVKAECANPDPQAPANIVAFGDSITLGYKNGNRSWADFLNDRLGVRGVTVLKEADTGRKIVDVHAFEHSAYRRQHPSVVIEEGKLRC